MSFNVEPAPNCKHTANDFGTGLADFNDLHVFYTVHQRIREPSIRSKPVQTPRTPWDATMSA
jgi:hypothetical protein